jgi:protein AATF/BFR2
VQLVDETLAEHEKLVEKTQVRRGKSARIGAVLEDSEDQARGDVEIFDDTDFYQKLLRDVIDSRGGGEGADDWLVQQKQKKAKKKVDTKASKGRKLRFAVSYLIFHTMLTMWL